MSTTCSARPAARNSRSSCIGSTTAPNSRISASCSTPRCTCGARPASGTTTSCVVCRSPTRRSTRTRSATRSSAAPTRSRSPRTSWRTRCATGRDDRRACSAPARRPIRSRRGSSSTTERASGRSRLLATPRTSRSPANTTARCSSGCSTPRSATAASRCACGRATMACACRSGWSIAHARSTARRSWHPTEVRAASRSTRPRPATSAIAHAASRRSS